MANNAVISISANNMIVQSMQGSITSFWWLSIGFQQWGFLSGGGSQKFTWTYPQSFKSSVYSIQLAMRSGGSSNAVYNAFKTTSYSLTKWQGYMSLKEDVSFFLLAIGVQQWGYKEQLTADATNYPIPFNSFCYVIAFAYKHPSSGSTTHAVIADKTNSGFEFYVGQYSMMPYPASNASGWWLAWGVQQWGYNTQSEDYNVKVALPIAYAIKHYIVVSNAEDQYAGDIYVTGSYKLTLTNFMLSKTQSTQPVFWISLGIQQWGYTEKSTVTLPITYTKYCCVAMSINWGYAAVKIENLVKLTFVDVHSAQCFRYITIGVQQWGVNIGQASLQTYSYPIAFSAGVYVHVCSGVVTSNFWNNPAMAGKITLTTFGIGAYGLQSGKIHWMALGCQQWGKCNAGTQFSFPIPYKIKCYAITFGVHYDRTQYGYNQVVSYNTLGFTMYQALGTGNIASMWISLGR